MTAPFAFVTKDALLKHAGQSVERADGYLLLFLDRALGFGILGFEVLGFRLWGFGILGFGALGLWDFGVWGLGFGVRGFGV